MVGITLSTAGHLMVVVPKFVAPAWAGLLRRGVGVFLEKEICVRDFMTSVLGMDSNYATNSVPGLFLNNAPVDDWTGEMRGGGAEVGMSGTRPGLCGIALRRSSPIKSFRPDLHSRHGIGPRAGGVATVKMFNFVALDCCQSVLDHGVIVPAKSLLQYMDEQGISLDDCACVWNGTPMDFSHVREALAQHPDDIELRVAA